LDEINAGLLKERPVLKKKKKKTGLLKENCSILLGIDCGYFACSLRLFN